MKLFIYSVKDTATQSFGTPMFMMAPGQMMRSFLDEVNRPAEDNQLYKHPSDFHLYEIGVFNTDTGEITSNVVFVTRAEDVLTKTESAQIAHLRGVN